MRVRLQERSWTKLVLTSRYVEPCSTGTSCDEGRSVWNQSSPCRLQAGISTDELDKLAHAFCIERNAYPSPLNYKWFPKSICTSINNVACHGIPDDRKLKDGDIISVDVSVSFLRYKNPENSCFKLENLAEFSSSGPKLISFAFDRFSSMAIMEIARKPSRWARWTRRAGISSKPRSIALRQASRLVGTLRLNNPTF